MDNDSRVLVAGANGMVGSAIVRNLESKGYANIIKATRQVVDFTDQEATDAFFRFIKPEYVFVAAAKVGGIMANNNYKADFLTENLRIQTNIIDAAHRFNVKKLLFLGSSCIYPKFANQPIAEDQLMTGPLEPTNDAYAIAKIAGIMMCQAYRQQHGFNAISLMPTNLYGPNDNFDLETSHVLPAMIAKYHYATTEGYTIDMGGPWWRCKTVGRWFCNA
jgi:GDP-L-fucose synthase